MHRRHLTSLPEESAARRLQRANEQADLARQGKTLTPAMKSRLRDDRGGGATPRELASIWRVRESVVEEFLAGLDRGEDVSE